MSKDHDISMVDAHVNQLLEHFDSVQIFVTKNSQDGQDGTIRVSTGGGNWFARYGQIKYWAEQEDAIARSEAVREE